MGAGDVEEVEGGLELESVGGEGEARHGHWEEVEKPSSRSAREQDREKGLRAACRR